MDDIDLLVKMAQIESDLSRKELGIQEEWTATREWAINYCKMAKQTPAEALAQKIKYKAELAEMIANPPPPTEGQLAMEKLEKEDPETWFHIAAHHDPSMLFDPQYAHFLEPKK